MARHYYETNYETAREDFVSCKLWRENYIRQIRQKKQKRQQQNNSVM
ncbi:MAG: hypothetical protein NZ901_04830 [Geminocystis sp.]|nr:hypothetical protein [Geminocystis sp.]MCS7147498.1 hypothetical protein [Geminocystis sp.]MDW8115191.1 hypothetical protein [Geminocystis sp.]MDW8464460.1 hypothetical protein [Geminocystis sp.]